MTDIITRSSGADSDTRSFAEQKRAEKRAAADEIGVDAPFIDHLVEALCIGSAARAWLGACRNSTWNRTGPTGSTRWRIVGSTRPGSLSCVSIRSVGVRRGSVTR